MFAPNQIVQLPSSILISSFIMVPSSRLQFCVDSWLCLYKNVIHTLYFHLFYLSSSSKLLCLGSTVKLQYTWQICTSVKWRVSGNHHKYKFLVLHGSKSWVLHSEPLQNCSWWKGSSAQCTELNLGEKFQPICSSSWPVALMLASSFNLMKNMDDQ